eukprot:SAG31_NODE_37644_length_302_cov_1.266010_1_plen_53_part_01
MYGSIIYLVLCAETQLHYTAPDGCRTSFGCWVKLTVSVASHSVDTKVPISWTT